MPGKRYSNEEITAILKDWSTGLTAEQAAKKHKVTIQTLYRWKRDAGEIGERKEPPRIGRPSSAQTLSELRAENARLKSVIADLMMEKYSAA